MSENQPRLSNDTRSIRAAKVKDIAKLSEIIKIQNEEERQMRLEDKRHRESE